MSRVRQRRRREAPRRRGRADPSPARRWTGRFARGMGLWLVPVVVTWALLTPFYNRFLTHAAENLVRLTERPGVTRLLIADPHHLVITRTDLPPSRGPRRSVQTTDVHFPLILVGVLFLAVPGISWRTRAGALGWALLVSVFFHIISLFFWVKFVYALELGEWSLETYSAWERNFWALGKHLLSLPFKLALPWILWAGFHYRHLPLAKAAEAG